MAKTVDLRTYVLLEKAFVRRLQRSWQQQSAPLYAKITQACNDHKWDEARRLVPDLDMAEVGTENREWITYMLLSCAVFGANIVAKKTPSFVGVGTFDTFLKQTTNNMLQYLEYNATSQVQAQALQSIAEDEVKTKALKWDESEHPRDKAGKFTVAAYHGTSSVFDQFADPPQGKGIYFTTDREEAERYAGISARGGGVPRVVEATVTLQKDGSKRLAELWRLSSKEQYAQLKKEGYDGFYQGDMIVVFSGGQVRITKWDEAKHPRDQEGQFTDKGTTASDMEGAGPERKKWVKLNQAVMDTFDAYFAAKEVHKKLFAGADQRLNELLAQKPNASADELNAAMDRDPAYVKSRQIAQAAKTAFEEAEKALKAQEVPMKLEVVRNLVNDTAIKMGVSPWHINVVDREPPEFHVGEKTFTEGGHYNPADEMIEINVRNLMYGDAPEVKGMADHELSHFIYHTMKAVADREFKEYLAKAVTPDGHEHTAWYHERFEKNPKNNFAKRLKPEYREEMAKAFPASMALAGLAGGDPFTGISQEMVNENGHSAYARSYWSKEAVEARGHSYETAINETIAELSRWLNHPSSWHEASTPQPSSPWVKMTVAMHQWYKDRQARINAAMAKSRAV